jgi:hypothetical protein
VILHCNYEELRALRHGARVVLGDVVAGVGGVAAPPDTRARVEAMVPRLDGVVRLTNLQEQRDLRGAVSTIVERLRADMEAMVLTAHPADESAVSAYFDFAHTLSVLRRLEALGEEMEALIEVVTGRPVDQRSVTTFRFPD